MNKVKIELFKEIVDDMLEIYKRKNADYGDSFSIVREEYPNAILIRLSDKLERLKTIMETNKQNVTDESIKDTLKDLANYCILELIEMELDEAYDEVVGNMSECSCDECGDIHDIIEETREEIEGFLQSKYGEDLKVKFIEI